MVDISNNIPATKPVNTLPKEIPPPDDGRNLNAHYTNNMKVKRPQIKPEEVKIIIPEQKLFSDKEATRRIQELNTDIYEKQMKEKSNHEFNFKTYFKIVIGLLIAAAGIAGLRRIIRFFGK